MSSEMSLHVLDPSLLPSNSIWVLVLFSTFCLLVLFHMDGRALFIARRKQVWTPRGFPLLGNTPVLLFSVERDLEYFYNKRKERRALGYGEEVALSLTTPMGRILDVTNPIWLEHVEKKAFHKYGKPPILKDVSVDFLGHGIFVSDGDHWKFQRQIFSNLFTFDNIRSNLQMSVVDGLEQLVKLIDTKACEGKVFDFQELCHDFSLNLFCSMVFGKPLDIVKNNFKESSFAKALNASQLHVRKRFINPLWKFTEQVTGVTKEINKIVKDLDDFAYSCINERRLLAQSLEKKPHNPDFLDYLLNYRDDDGKPLSDQFIRDSMVHLLVASRDTTAQTLSWTMYHLLTNPNWYDAVLEEAEEAMRLGGISFDVFDEQLLTTACINETLRLHPPAPRNTMVALQDDQLPNGPEVKKGDIVFWSTWQLGRDELLWGEDATEYKPERWISENHTIIKQTCWKSHSFGGGPRTCMGKQLAMFEVVATLSTLLDKFDFKLAPDCTAPETIPGENLPRYKAAISLPMNGPLLVVATRRDS